MKITILITLIILLITPVFATEITKEIVLTITVTNETITIATNTQAITLLNNDTITTTTLMNITLEIEECQNLTKIIYENATVNYDKIKDLIEENLICNLTCEETEKISQNINTLKTELLTEIDTDLEAEFARHQGKIDDVIRICNSEKNEITNTYNECDTNKQLLEKDLTNLNQKLNQDSEECKKAKEDNAYLWITAIISLIILIIATVFILLNTTLLGTKIKGIKQ